MLSAPKLQEVYDTSWHQGFSRRQCIGQFCWLVAAADPLGKQGDRSCREHKPYLSCLSEYQTSTFWWISEHYLPILGLFFGFFCQVFQETDTSYDSKITLIIWNVPERHLDCYLSALELVKEKLGEKKDFIIKYTLLNFFRGTVNSFQMWDNKVKLNVSTVFEVF